jgi:fused signal recognition particle receptor
LKLKISNIFNALSKTRNAVKSALNNVLGKQVNEDTLEELESQLILADMGIHTVNEILSLFHKKERHHFLPSLKEYLSSQLKDSNHKDVNESLPMVIFIVGVNGTGKTTSTAKLAHYYCERGFHPMLIGADTYRAGAIAQLRSWSNRLDIRFIANEQTKDPSAILYDGLYSAQKSQIDLVIVDTAGRLHTHSNLMEELKKMERVVKTKFSSFSLQTLITIDSTLGQNSLQQAMEFQRTILIDGAILTKLDGTAKGGIVFPLVQRTGIPVRFIGTGEDLDNFSVFNSEEYVSSLVDI